MVVAAGNDPNQQIARTGDRVDLENLGDGSEVSDDTVVRPLRDGQRREGQNAKPCRSGVDVWTVANDHFSVLEPAQSCQHRSPRAVEGAGQIRDSRVRSDTQFADQSAVERVKGRWAILQGDHGALEPMSETDHIVKH